MGAGNGSGTEFTGGAAGRFGVAGFCVVLGGLVGGMMVLL